MKLPALMFSVVALLACVGGVRSAAAAIDVIPKEIVVGKDTEFVQIVNNGNRPEFVNVSLARLLNPGVPLGDETTQPVGDIERPSLYAYPFRMSLAPGQTKTIVIKPMQAVDTETVYRLDVRPVINASSEKRQAMAGSIVVNLGFSALVRQLPASEKASLSVSCDASGAQLTATGNVRYTVKHAEVDGQPVERFNVYPGVQRPLTGRVVKIPGQPVCGGRADSAAAVVGQ
ncbi:hypothetical protein L2Y90_23895 [Burkholderia pyrrocinia]|uniref:hypothetical protein n=1 Tax=Burkholderia pyrrocinia TaxID=60550 RepID=UPI00215A4B72|nr:hypothetical protein [Burkholderia pyrrocinia]UVE69761.1 hypothetical protein L2Y90_23895 [Burkholderia pyrrocinia]